jgi:integrase
LDILTPSSQGNQKASARAAGASRRAVGTAALPPLRATRLLDQVRERARGLHYSVRTEEAYVFWCRDFVRFHGLRHPVEMGGPEVEAFLTHLAAQRGLSVSSHRQALSALLFFYGKVLGQQLPWMDEIGRPVPKRRLPVVLSAQKVAAVLAELDGVHGLLARLLYGTGLRIEEALRLRVKDLDFANQAIFVRSGKGGKDRVVMMPRSLTQALRRHLPQSWGQVLLIVSLPRGHCRDQTLTASPCEARASRSSFVHRAWQPWCWAQAKCSASGVRSAKRARSSAAPS